VNTHGASETAITNYDRDHLYGVEVLPANGVWPILINKHHYSENVAAIPKNSLFVLSWLHLIFILYTNTKDISLSFVHSHLTLRL
jgi:hypothetical protein